jgi:uncharacterized membrane protein
VETRIKVLGHPVHPMLIVLPLALLSTAAVFDVLYVVTGNADLATFAYWAVLVGIIGGLLAAIFGAIDWMAIPKEMRARRIGGLHGAGNVAVVLLFGVSWLARGGSGPYLPATLPMLLAVAAVVIALGTAWLGGELVYRLRVAVNDDAGLGAGAGGDQGPVGIGGPVAYPAYRGGAGRRPPAERHPRAVLPRAVRVVGPRLPRSAPRPCVRREAPAPSTPLRPETLPCPTRTPRPPDSSSIHVLRTPVRHSPASASRRPATSTRSCRGRTTGRTRTSARVS